MFPFLASPISKALETVAGIVDEFVETPDEKRDARQLKDKLVASAANLQVELNKIESAHRSVFVAGWRPFVGWVCGAALAWHFIFFDLLNWAAGLFGVPPPPPLTGTSELLTVLLSMLGLGGLRTVEKLSGRAK